MRLSKGFWQTFKEVPSDATIPSHKLMLRAGLIQKMNAGLYVHLPMGLRVIKKITNIIRTELDLSNCYEMLPPFVTPGELWKESGRWEKYGNDMVKAVDKSGRDICLSPTNEEAFCDVFRKTITSYKQLPLTLYQVNTKFRDEIRPRYGLMRCREFIMKDAYSFHTNDEMMDQVYEEMFNCYSRIFKKMNLEFLPVVADGGNIATGGTKTHEFQVLADNGEDKIIKTIDNSYAANLERAQTKRNKIERNLTDKTLEKVETKNKATIKDVCELLGHPEHHSLKSLVYLSIKNQEEEIILIQLLGDDELNELKLKNYLGSDHVRPATNEELVNNNLVKGFIGPIGNDKLRTIFDLEVDQGSAYIIGANERDFHYKGFIPEQELSNLERADLRLSKSGDIDIETNKEVVEVKGIEVGHIFQLGSQYTKSMNVSVLDENGKKITPSMGCYGIGVTRIAAAAIEQNHDDNGIVWPAAIAPYQVYFVVITKSEDFLEKAVSLYESLQTAGIEVLLDDRKASPGFKFKDSDLLGLPIRIVMGERDFKESGELEYVIRKSGEKGKVKLEDVENMLREKLKDL